MKCAKALLEQELVRMLSLSGVIERIEPGRKELKEQSTIAISFFERPHFLEFTKEIYEPAFDRRQSERG